MKKMISIIKSCCKLAVIAAAVFCGVGLTATKVRAAERKYYIVYHDDYRNIIRRDAYTSGYTFDAQDPYFWVAMPVTNIAWCTVFTERGQEPVFGARVYNTGDVLSTPLTSDLHLYPVTSFGTFVRFDSDGGAPFHYQFVHVGAHATNPGTPSKTGYTFDGWYQVLMDADGNETGLATTQFDFNGWSPVKTALEDPTKEIVLRAKWNPTNVDYTIHVWLEKAEHPNRADLSDAQAHAFDDYDYGMTITKTGTSEGAVAFTSSDRSSNAIKDLTYFNNDRSTFPLYFYDNANGSFAQSMSEASVATTTVDPTGATIVNVFYRRIVFKPTIGVLTTGYNGKTNTTKNWDTSYEHPTVIMRNGEMLGSAIQRAIDNGTVTLSQSTIGMFQTDTTPKDCGYFGFWELTGYSGFTCGYNSNFPEGGLWAQSVAADMVYIAQGHKLTGTGSTNNPISDEFTLYVLMPTETKRGNEFRRDYYIQTLDAALNNRTDVLATGNAIANPSANYYSDYTYYSYKSNTTDGFQENNETGFTLYQTQNVKRDADGTINAVNFADSRTGGNYICYDPNGYVLEVFYKRNSYTVDFHTGTSRVSVHGNSRFSNVFYEEPLSNIVSLIVTTGGDAFVIGETYYEDDQGARYIFQGWYDNAALEGNSVDFANYLMPAHNVQLYAKWEKQVINVTFDADGGTIQGGDTYVMTIPSGQIPYMADEPISPDPTRLEFFSWTSDGEYYEFLDPFYTDATLVALYYTDPADPLKITYKAGAGTGEDVLEFADYGYVYNANAGVLDFFPDWTAAKGKIFKHWVDEDGNTYEPYDEIYMKHDVTLTAVYEGGHADIVINREGLLEDETAIFDVYRMVDDVKTFVMRVSLTGTDSEGTTVSRTLLNMEPGTYVVEETAWSWAYEKGTTTVKEGEKTATTSSVNGTGTGTVAFEETLEFTFTGDPLTNVTKHAEDAQINQFAPKTTE